MGCASIDFNFAAYIERENIKMEILNKEVTCPECNSENLKRDEKDFTDYHYTSVLDTSIDFQHYFCENGHFIWVQTNLDKKTVSAWGVHVSA